MTVNNTNETHRFTERDMKAEEELLGKRKESSRGGVE